MNGSDQDLARAFVDGASGALRTVDAWIGASLRPFRRRMQSACDDVAQEARMELLTRLRQAQFRGETGLKTYVWRISTHAAITRLRRESSRPAASLDETPPVSASGPSALDIVLKAESDRVVRGVLAEVDAPCRDLWRDLLAGRTYAEIGAETGVSEGALRVRAMRCRQAAIAARARLTGGPHETKSSAERRS